ncbi:poly(A) polymerase [Hoeflea sp. BAL378]|uniref:CCA tRNA nucleotidyltransferase n=1 Tax=Hoeflea sp. BAL378 TaxID=1547437 RepID=UPI000513F43C|nr:CCA tRNA nucleotidyltransferase [Hoeflea sp. BAL378]KGF67995.1 poly(A) polymerase [Hoeflea sp. BAL378]
MSTAASVAGEAWFKDPALTRIFALLNREGEEVRVVGGAVRNALMGLPVTDTDLATTWAPEQVMSQSEAAGIRAVPTGIDHGTVTLVIDGRGFEVTTLRHDAETDGRRAKVVFGSDWQTDAARRDFTINALYADSSGAIIDLVGGLEDIASRTVRFIGEPDDRIAEDHLRILRYFRFFAHYGAGRPDAAALKACARARDSLVKLSAERVWKELKTLFAARDPGRALLWMRQAGILSLVVPESEKWGIDSVGGLIATEEALGWEPDPLLRLMAIVPPDAERMREMSARMKLSRADTERLVRWAEAPAVAPTLAITALDRLLYRHGAQPLMDRIRLSLVAARARTDTDASALTDAAGHSRHLARAAGWTRPMFPVTGSDLIAKGIKPGPEMGARLSALEELWIDSNFTLDKEALLTSAE